MSSDAGSGLGLRYLLYARDGVGIGHLVRTCMLARRLRRRLPQAEILVASGSPALARFAPADCLTLHLPPHLPHGGDGETPRARERRRARRRWRRGLLRTTFDEFAPHVLLVDHAPAGKKDELLDVLESPAARGTTCVLGYRRIAESSESIREKLCHPVAARLLTDVYRVLLVYAPPWVLERFGPLTSAPIPQIYTGFVSRNCRMSQQRARQRLRLPGDGRIVVCGLGGGRDAWPLADRILQTWNRTARDGWLVLFCGPFLDAPRVCGRRVRLVRDTTGFPVGVAAADGVICSAGYNSMLETLRVGRPLWAIPNQAEEREQHDSAGLLEELGYVRRIVADADFEARLESAFAAILAGTPNRRAPRAWFEGSGRAGDVLVRLGIEAQEEERCGPPSAS